MLRRRRTIEGRAMSGWAEGFFGIKGVKILPATLLVCLAAAFVLRPMPVWALTFYAGVVPATVYRLWRGANFPWRDPRVLLIGLLVLWSGLTLLWGINPGGGRVEKFALAAVCTTLFFIALVVSTREVPEMIRYCMTVIIVVSACNAALSIILFFGQYIPYLPPAGARLNGWAETYNSILGALVISIGYLAALDRLIRERRNRFANCLSAILCFTFVALTGSRGPLLSLLAATVVLMWGSVSRFITTLVILAMAGATLGVSAPSFVQDLLSRPSHRVPIWEFTLGRIAEHPWIGHGLAAYLGMSAEFTFPHSLYLSALFYGGLVGFFLLTAVILQVTWGLLKLTRASGQPLLLALWMSALCGGLTDLGQVTEGPSELWLVFWLPLSLSCAVLSGAAYEPRVAYYCSARLRGNSARVGARSEPGKGRASAELG
ncbi:MAG TPA: O-antigen ligase family protein [Stellaceae bacterium]|jgi:O-antigen ligase|nr:O-antigen ligase family protein [Stellaceae bacterium]